ncbi:MAG: dethiobiotin synthase [Holosporales bacterium]|jgi:dethiobiotin synthase|nr:dethiobiotin synthase [Holosporales bacterium]
MNIFVTGTDTDVGKTVVSAWLCYHTGKNYWKPIQTGGDSDRSVVEKISPHTKIVPEVYRLIAPLSPYDASKLERIEIDKNLFARDIQNTVIEGAGGALVPIASNFLMADLIRSCNAKTLIVARSKIGMINHILMTAEVLRSRGIDIIGIVVNGEIVNDLRHTIEEFTKLEVLSVMLHGSDIESTIKSTAVPSKILEILR